MKILTKTLLGALLGVGLAGAALSAGLTTNGLPPAGGSQYPSTVPLTGNELGAFDTQLPSGLNPASEAISTQQISAFAAAQGNAFVNYLVGGDFGQNLWQRGTTGTATTTALTYGPDRWWALSGTGTEVKIIKETGASDITTGFAASARLQRTASQTGVVASCMGQVLTTGNSTSMAGKTVEFSFYGLVGANFSAANSVVTATIATGTGASESAANFSTGAWTGYAVASAQSITLSTTWGRYSAVAAIPATATQVGVKICFTPVGTAGADDWFEIGQAQLDINAGAVAATSPTDTNYSIAAFVPRISQDEANLEKSYFWLFTETNGVYVAPGMASATNVERAVLEYPVPMRTTPTCTFTSGGFKWDLNGTDTSVGTLTQVTGTTSEVLTIGDTTTATVGWTAFLFGSSTTGLISCTAEL